MERIAANSNFAFSHETQTNLEVADLVHAGNFVGIERPTADIGGFKIIALGADTQAFTIDDFSDGPLAVVPEPTTWGFLLAGLLAAGLARRMTG